MSVLGNQMSSKNNFLIKVRKTYFFVLTFVVIFLKLYIVQSAVCAHFKAFFCAINMRVIIKVLVIVEE